MPRTYTMVVCLIALAALACYAAAGADEAKKAEPAKKAEAPGALTTQKQKASYCLGLFLGRNLKQQGIAAIHVDPDALVKGLIHSLTSGKPALSSEEMQKVMQAFQAELQAHGAKIAKENADKGKAFLAANGKKEGVKSTKSGLQYKVVKEGTGKSPKASDTVICHYKGTLLDGTEFDSSGDTPAEFALNRVIPGWTEGVQLMKEGGKMMLYVPSDLAYRESPRGPGGPNSTLIFEIELIKIK